MVSMQCPRCGGGLVGEQLNGVSIDRCSTCAGVWLADVEIISPLRADLVIEQSTGQDDSVAGPSGKAGVPMSERESVEQCPKCQAHLDAVNYDYGSGIIIDVYPNGHGIWLDSGELEHLKIYKSEAEDKFRAQAPQLAVQLRRLGQNTSSNETHRATTIGNRLLDALADLFFQKNLTYFSNLLEQIC